MSQTTILIITVIVVLVALLLLYLRRGRKQHVSFEGKPETMLNQRPAPIAPTPVAKVTPAPAPSAERHGVGSEVSAAIEDVVDQFMGLDAHPSGQDQVTHAGDTLTTLKGLGPKAATLLNGLGVTTFAQIAAWDEGDVQAIDAQLGAFKGRIRRDKWVEQARLLAKGDTAAFEEAFGNLG